MDWKNTLLMPNTNFEMRGHLNKKDSIFIDKTLNLFKLINESKAGKIFILHDGPPYANGDIHVGHAFNKILKDIVIRNQLLRNRKVDIRPGWDAHGLPIENEIQKNGIKLNEVGEEQYLKEGRNYALSQIRKQEKQFKRLNLFSDFENKYITLDPKFEASEIKVFHSFLNQGYIYQDFKPVYWSWSSKTAMAEAEIEYIDSEDDSIFVKFKLDDLNFIIWTTTPWTLPANVAIAFSKNIAYGIYEYNNEKLVIANELKSSIEKKIKIKLKKLQDIDIFNFIGKNAINPLNGNISRIIWGEHIAIEEGTGLVHIAGGHGLDDFKLVKKNDLKLVVVMDAKGYMQNSGLYNGMFYLKANKQIIEDLKKNLLHYSIRAHSIPIDWRTKKPIVYRATKQWFVSISKVKEQIIKNINTVKWLPEWGNDRLSKMTENREDWGISRQRLWGVPIPIIYDSNNYPIINKDLQENIEKLFEEKGKIGWHQTNIKNILPDSIEYDKGMRKEQDILDVWFDSGSSFNALGIKKADLYLEGNDQYRGWFNSSLIASTILNGEAPYKKVITHGMVTDAKGNKMSKSTGNVISPLDIIDKFGSDILRLWVASSDYTDNTRISNDIIAQISNEYRKIRNTIRFMLGTTSDLDREVEAKSLITKAIYDDINASWTKINSAYENNEYTIVVKEVITQITSGSISYLNEYAKEIVYVYGKDWDSRREIQTLIKHGLNFILFNIAPILPMTIEEAYSFMNNGEKSFFILNQSKVSEGNSKNFKEFSSIRDVANKSLEEFKEKNKDKYSQSKELDITLPKKLKKWSIDLNKFLQVAQANILEGNQLEVKVKNSSFLKCDRCWKHVKILNEQNICDTCVKAIKT